MVWLPKFFLISEISPTHCNEVKFVVQIWSLDDSTYQGKGLMCMLDSFLLSLEIIWEVTESNLCNLCSWLQSKLWCRAKSWPYTSYTVSFLSKLLQIFIWHLPHQCSCWLKACQVLHTQLWVQSQGWRLHLVLLVIHLPLLWYSKRKKRQKVKLPALLN